MKLKILSGEDQQIKKIKNFIAEWNNNNEYISQYTSGSTGKPKLIKIPKWKMLQSAKITGAFFNLETCTSSMMCMSVDYIGGKMMIVRSLLYNLTVYITKVEKNPIENLNQYVDFAAMVPLQVETILSKNPEKLNLIKYLIIGGAPVSDTLIEKLKSYKCRFFATFGMTETVSHIALRNLKDPDNPYFALGNTTFSTVENKLVISNEDLKISGLQTNDIVDLIDNKTFFWLGRADFVINSGGIKIHPETVERKIQKIINSTDFIIGSITDEELGSKIVFIGEEKLKKHVLKNDIEHVLEKYEKPKSYFFVKQLIKTASGKIDRNSTNSLIL